MEKEINVYDLNTRGFEFLYSFLKNKGVKINRVDNLPPTDNSLPIIISPASPILKNAHWTKIKEYIERNSTAKVLFMDTSDTKSELEDLIGKKENIKYLMTQETRMKPFYDLYDKIFNELEIN